MGWPFYKVCEGMATVEGSPGSPRVSCFWRRFAVVCHVFADGSPWFADTGRQRGSPGVCRGFAVRHMFVGSPHVCWFAMFCQFATFCQFAGSWFAGDCRFAGLLVFWFFGLWFAGFPGLPVRRVHGLPGSWLAGFAVRQFVVRWFVVVSWFAVVHEGSPRHGSLGLHNCDICRDIQTWFFPKCHYTKTLEETHHDMEELSTVMVCGCGCRQSISPFRNAFNEEMPWAITVPR